MARLRRKQSQEDKRKKRLTRTDEPSTAVSESNGPGAPGNPESAAPARKKLPSTPRKDIMEARARTESEGKIKAWFNQAGQFLREAKVELKKVAWPSRKQTLGSTVVVLILVFAFAAFLGLADMVLAGIVRFVLQ
ncbi:MAG: preprotein translocase subunit SecE [Desulfobacterales bacterium]